MSLPAPAAQHDEIAWAMPSLLVHEAVNYTPGQMVPWHFTPSIIVASFFASLSGTLLTIELLQRKRLGKSLTSR